MIPQRLKFILLASLVLAFVALPSVGAQQRQRRVFTNEDFPSAAPPPAPPAPAETPAVTPAEGAPATDSAAAEGEDPAANLPPGLALAENLQGVLRRYMTDFSEKLDQEVDVNRQERWRTMMTLTIQLMAQNQQYIAELRAQQREAEADAQAQAGAP